MKNYPILRLAIPLSAGVFFAERFHALFPLDGVLVALAVLLAVLGLWSFFRNYAGRWMFGAGVAVLLFMAGYVRMEGQWKQVNVDWPSEKRAYRGTVQEMPVEKERSIQYRVRVNGRDVLLYLSKDAMSGSVDMGGQLLFHARIEKPVNRKDSSEFDYARYLLLQKISGVAFASSASWKKLERKPELTLKQRALKVRERIVDEYRSWGWTGDRLAALSALTIGHKAELDDGLRERYSVAGISHVLALSGLHIGIVWMLFNFLLRPLERNRLGAWIKWVASTASLWIFAFIAGLEASVVRAVVMCMLMELGRVAGNRALSLNTWGIAAFFMLLYNPFYLFDVGFQLSFMAVLFILLYYPLVYRLFPLENRLCRWGWGVVSVSMSAQLGTAPLVMYCFSNFSVYFLLANVVASVLVPLIIGLGFLALFLSLVPVLQVGVVKVLGGLVDGINFTAHEISGWPLASLSCSDLTMMEVGGMYGVLFFAWSYWKTSSRKAFIGILVCLSGILVARLCVVV